MMIIQTSTFYENLNFQFNIYRKTKISNGASLNFKVIKVYKLLNAVSSFAIGARHIRLNFSYKHPQPLSPFLKRYRKDYPCMIRGACKEEDYGKVLPLRLVPALPYTYSETALS